MPEPPQLSLFFFIPDPILDRYDALTVAVYGGIARYCVAHSGPVPLSAPDLATLFGLRGEPGRVAIMRRIQRLTADGWLEATALPGKKPKLQPTWGRSREGALRRWDWTLPDRGRPDWQRGRRVPLALFDDYLGRLVPHYAVPADHSVWWDRPLLDGVDAGTWVIGLRRAIAPTPRLTHLGLTSQTLLTLDELRERVQSGQLTTLEGTVIGISQRAEPDTRSQTCSSTRSPWGSDHRGAQTAPSAAPGRDAPEKPAADDLIAWESWNKLINIMIPPEESDHQIGSGDDRFGVEQPQLTNLPNTTSHPAPSQSLTACDENHSIDPQVIVGHESLNPGIVIPPGEWLELARIQTQHGAAAMLIWQARATRRTHAASGRVVPAYYAACAAREAADAYQPPRPRHHYSASPEPPPADQIDAEPADPETIPAPRLNQRTSATPAKPTIAPDADALLRAMGLRARSALAEVPLDLIRQWQPLVEHVALVARFPRDHRGWIWTQLRDQMLPPSAEELASWRRATGRQEPTDWREIAEASDGLMRLGDDLSGLDAADAAPPEPLPDTPVARLDAVATMPPVAATRADDLADQLRAEVRLRSGDRALRQILDRARIEQHGDGLLVRCALADLRLLLTHTVVLRAAAIGADLAGIVQCVAF